MDSVRFGRILGKGARTAAKGLYEAVDAATAPNPNPPLAAAPQQRQTAQAPVQAAVHSAAQSIAQSAAAYTAHKNNVSRQSGRMGRPFLAPFARAGHVLWLEVMGTFFALFAAIFISGVFRYRAALRLTADNADAHRHVLFSAGAAAVFSYFAVSSFVRARRRERR
ncbi:MAG TPA: hypothetical protein VNU94_08595 [Acidobacteriaceae bacterium]|jgi:hypothetical protein|nr:hypothetical protein [Acidobacteriaceae bacterium]